MSIAGFGSLLSIDSARSTFPDLRNFRVRQVCTGSCLSLCTCCMRSHVQRQTYVHVVACMLTLEKCWPAVLQLLTLAAGCRLPASICAHGANILPARHRAAGYNGDQQPQLRGGSGPLHRRVGLRRALQPCHGRGKRATDLVHLWSRKHHACMNRQPCMEPCLAASRHPATAPANRLCRVPVVPVGDECTLCVA
jgi:hypothetical protein